MTKMNIIYPNDPRFAEMMARGEIASGADLNAEWANRHAPQEISPKEVGELHARIARLKSQTDRDAATAALNRRDIYEVKLILRAGEP